MNKVSCWHVVGRWGQ